MVRILLVLGAAVAGILGLVLLFLLTQATNNRELYERNYVRLFALNLVVAGLLLAVIVGAGLRLYWRLKQGRYGSQLLVKLAAIFAFVGFMPGLLIYGVSYQFVSRSIESWFDVKVESALSAGVSLGRTSLDTLSSDWAKKTQVAAESLRDLDGAAMPLVVDRIREQLGADDVVAWSMNGTVLASAGASRFQLSPERPSSAILRRLKNQPAVAMVEGLDEVELNAANNGTPGGRAHIRAFALVPEARLGLFAEPRILQVTVAMPDALVANALAVEVANREYQERALGRVGLQRMYIATLTLSLFLAVLGSIILAVLLGNQLARPLLVLAEGVREVSLGNLSPKAALSNKDELGGLTRAFADMTQQLFEARATVDQTMNEVSTARANLQTILDNLTAGVMVLDEQGHLLSANPGAMRILGLPLTPHLGKTLDQIPGLRPFAERVDAQLKAVLNDPVQPHGSDHWQQSFELSLASKHRDTALHEPHNLTLVTRAAALPGQAQLLVFDDITQIVSAQRAQAWGEVARRLAHEIKNPLTPIQLSAERLEMKLSGKVAPPEQAVLTKSVKTIVDQVDAMKRLVNEFRDYARLPAAHLESLNLNDLVTDVVQLYGADPSQAGAPGELQVSLDPRCPPIQGDPQQLRQVIHNLLQNAQDACEAVSGEGGQPPGVEISTQWSESAQRVRLVVRDHGTGFADAILKRAFEPYVTTKTKGTGLGLAVVKKIVDDHGARIDLSNVQENDHIVGAKVSLSFKAEQPIELPTS